MSQRIGDQLFSEELQQLILSGGNLLCSDLHEGTCLQSALLRFFINAKTASKYVFPVYLIPMLLFQRKQLKKYPAKTLKKFGKEFLCSIIFLGGFIASCKYLLCKIKNLRGAVDPISPALAGCLSSVFMLFEKRSRQQDIVLYVIPRFLEMVWLMLQKRGLVFKVDNWEFVIFALGMGMINYYYINEPERIKPSYLKFFQVIWN